jgi:predicted transcriptional regulator
MNDIEHAILAMATSVVSAFVSNNDVRSDELPGLIQSTYDAIKNTEKAPEPEVPVQEPAVSIRSSIKPDFIVCLEDGKKLKMLKRHLMTHYNLTPEQYRAKWNLPSDYPMTAPNYAAKRAELAKKIGLGVKQKTAAPNAPAAPTPAPAPEPEVQTEVVE